MRVARLFLFADWPEKYFSGQSEGGISNASGTRSVTVSAQGLSHSCCKLSPTKIFVPTSCPWVSEDAYSRALTAHLGKSARGLGRGKNCSPRSRFLSPALPLHFFFLSLVFTNRSLCGGERYEQNVEINVTSIPN